MEQKVQNDGRFSEVESSIVFLNDDFKILHQLVIKLRLSIKELE